MSVGGRPVARGDVWTLLAVAYIGWDGPGAAPGTVAGLCRAIRRGPVDEDELRSSLGRLLDAGLVAESGEAFQASAAVSAFLAARIHRRGLWHDYRDLMRHLGLD